MNINVISENLKPNEWLLFDSNKDLKTHNY